MIALCQDTEVTMWIVTDWLVFHKKPGPEVIKLFSCSTQLSMKF